MDDKLFDGISYVGTFKARSIDIKKWELVRMKVSFIIVEVVRDSLKHSFVVVSHKRPTNYRVQDRLDNIVGCLFCLTWVPRAPRLVGCVCSTVLLIVV